jgi:hypothetical protein
MREKELRFVCSLFSFVRVCIWHGFDGCILQLPVPGSNGEPLKVGLSRLNQQVVENYWA